MSKLTTRRNVLKSAVAAASASLLIGRMGAKGVDFASREQVVAFADVDTAHAASAIKKIKDKFPDVKVYTDYRKLFDEVKDLDACWVATPDHHHFPASVRALEAGL